MSQEKYIGYLEFSALRFCYRVDDPRMIQASRL
jgi:hypothetical protein